LGVGWLHPPIQAFFLKHQGKRQSGLSFLPVAFFAFGPYNKHIDSKGAANTNPVRSAFCFIKSPTYLRDDTTEEKEFGKYGSNRYGTVRQQSLQRARNA
jgi:hypothetical protein